jgi:hypothetical protein
MLHIDKEKQHTNFEGLSTTMGKTIKAKNRNKPATPKATAAYM